MRTTSQDSRAEYAALEQRVARALLKARAALWAGKAELAAHYEALARRYVASYRGTDKKTA